MYRKFWTFSLITLWQMCLVLSANHLRPMSYVNSTAQYNSALSTFDLSPNTAITIECGYEDVVTELAYAPTRWTASQRGTASEKLFFDGRNLSHLVQSVVPTQVDKSFQLQSGKMNLTLRKMDESWYTAENPVVTVICQLVTLNGSSIDSSDNLIYKSSIDISIVEPAQIKDVAVTPAKVVNEGSNVTLTCVASGYPKPVITWTRGDGAYLAGSLNASVSVRGSVLELINVPRQAQASYTCSAANRVTLFPATRQLNLQVRYKPVVESLVLKYKQKVGYHLEMKCSVEAANPEATAVTWYHMPGHASREPNTYKVAIEAGDSRFHYSNFNGTNGHMASVFTIDYVQKADFDRNYCCQFSNEIGTGSTCMTVQESDTPVEVNGKAPKKGGSTSSTNQISAHISLIVLVSLLTISIF